MKKLLIFVLTVVTVMALSSCEVLEFLDSLEGGTSATQGGNGSENGGSENGGSENGGSENGGSENGGSENGGSENGGSENGGSENGGSEDDGTVPGLIFKEGIMVAVVKPSGDKAIDLTSVVSKVYELTGRLALSGDDKMTYYCNQLVFGNTSMDISAVALARLAANMQSAREEYEADGKDFSSMRGYLVYSDGFSVALVWSNEDDSADAINYFVEKYLSDSTLILEEGYEDFKLANKLESILEQEKAAREAAYAKAEQMYGADVVRAIDAHLGMFGEEFYLWLAGLYEKNATDLSGNVLGGGFYYSNSARDNEYYQSSPWSTKYYLLPDLESTSQVLTFMQKSGMMQSVGFTEAIPEEMREQIISFARALQSSEDGYFYHPQWGTGISTSRLSRDCSWGATILTRLGSKPYWNTPSGTSGIYGAPGASASSVALTSPLSQSTAVAVSKVVLAASAWTGAEHLATISAWESYLIEKTANIKNDSYSIGNTLSSQNSQIKNREKLAISNGELPDANGDGIAEGGYIETFKRIMDNLQCDNGLWEETASYNAINGLMKIVGAYGNLGLAVNNADKAILAAIATIDENANPDAITYVYNAWVATNSLLNNLTKYGDAAKATELREQIKSNAYKMITATTAQVAKFKKDDGSFGYTQDEVPYKSQGSIAAVRYTVEGDVNGGTIAFTGIWDSMCSVLEIDILPYGYEDLLKFIDAIDYER